MGARCVLIDHARSGRRSLASPCLTSSWYPPGGILVQFASSCVTHLDVNLKDATVLTKPPILHAATGQCREAIRDEQHCNDLATRARESWQTRDGSRNSSLPEYLTLRSMKTCDKSPIGFTLEMIYILSHRPVKPNKVCPHFDALLS